MTDPFPSNNSVRRRPAVWCALALVSAAMLCGCSNGGDSAPTAATSTSSAIGSGSSAAAPPSDSGASSQTIASTTTPSTATSAAAGSTTSAAPVLTATATTTSSAGSTTATGSEPTGPVGPTGPIGPTGTAPAELPAVGITGVNKVGCHSSQPPVVLLHGTASTPASNFTPLAARLLASGRCVFAVLYGSLFGLGGIGDIDGSARQVAAFIDRVRQATGMTKVDVIAFSEGALVLRDALQHKLNPATVRVAVLLAPNYHGTTVSLASKVPAGICPACSQQAAGSALLRRLAAGGELSGSIRYATLSTRQDTWVLPIADQSPRGPADRVRSELLQDSCPTATVRHIDLPAASAALTWTVAALETDGRPPTALRCD